MKNNTDYNAIYAIPDNAFHELIVIIMDYIGAKEGTYHKGKLRGKLLSIVLKYKLDVKKVLQWYAEKR